MVAPEIADATEAKTPGRVARRPRTGRPGSGCGGSGTAPPGITGLLPDAAATRLATYLEAFTNPRKDPEGRGAVS